MAAPRPFRRPVAVIVSVAVAAVAGLLVTAAALDDDEDESAGTPTTTTTRPPRPTTTTLAREFPSGDEWSISTAIVPPPAATTTAPATTTTTTVPGPPPVSPPAPGEYTYVERTADDDGEEEVERLYRIEDRPPAEGEQRVPGELHFLIRLETAAGSVTTITSWRPDVVLALQTFFRLPDAEGSCDWFPDLLQLQLPLSSDGGWQHATECTADFGSGQIEIERTGEFQVVRDERISVADQEVAVWRIESKETTRFRGSFERTDQEIRTWWFAPKYGLTVREEARRRHTTPDGTTDSRMERELVQLRPL